MRRLVVGIAVTCSLAVPGILVAGESVANALHRRPVAAAPTAPRTPAAGAAQTPGGPPATTTTVAPPTSSPSTSSRTPPSPFSATAPPTPSPDAPAALAARVVSAVRTVLPDAQIGLDVVDLTTGATVASADPARRFPSMSVVKLLIAIDVLARNDWAPPDSQTQQTLHQMLAASDDGLADTLWDADGGADIVSRDVALMGLTGTTPPADPEEWGDTQITAQDMVTVYRYLTSAVPPADRAVLTGALAAASRSGADGTDQFFGIPDGLPGSAWAIKQGWGTSGAIAGYHTTGLVGADERYAVVLLTAAPVADYTVLPGAVTAGIRQLAPTLTPRVG